MGMSNNYAITTPSERASEPIPPLPTDGSQVDLTEELDIAQMRSRVWYFAPGDRSSWHKHESQEELYALLDGPAQMKIGDEEEVIEVPDESIVRVAPETPRQLLNETETTTVWYIVAAPAELDGDLWDEEQNRFVPIMEWFS